MSSNLKNMLYSFLTIISPELNTRVLYWRKFHQRLDLNEPKTFNEKLLWLKLRDYSENSLVRQCADKYLVRDYLMTNGCGSILNELIGVYESVEDIPWEELPNQFVLKWNFGAGMNIVCSDKSAIDINNVKAVMRKWGKTKYWLPRSEMQYKVEKKLIICEKYLNSGNDKGLTDYKVYCFNGKPLTIFVMHDRGGQLKTEFFDQNWNILDNSSKYSSPKHPTPKPVVLNEMLDFSRIISKPFPFVRCDYYIVNDKLYFGEMTFTPAGGLNTSETIIDGRKMGEYLDIGV